MAARIRTVVWAESARDALDEVIAYIVRDSQRAAVRFLDAALQAAAGLPTLSERGRIVPELNDPSILRWRQLGIRLRERPVLLGLQPVACQPPDPPLPPTSGEQVGVESSGWR